MRVIIAGSRTLNPSIELIANILFYYQAIPSQILCGDCRGVDKAGEKFAIENNIPVLHCPAEWGKYGKIAGYVRNKYMAKHADALLLIWDGKSKGSAIMRELAIRYQLMVWEHIM